MAISSSPTATDGNTNARIVKFDKNGTFIKTWGARACGPGEMDGPHTLAITKGRLFLGDRGNNRIQIFDQDGNFIDQWDAVQPGERHLPIDKDDTIYVAEIPTIRKSSRRTTTAGSAASGSVSHQRRLERLIRIGRISAAEASPDPPAMSPPPAPPERRQDAPVSGRDGRCQLRHLHASGNNKVRQRLNSPAQIEHHVLRGSR